MSIGAIGALGGVLAVSNIAGSSRIGQIEKALPENRGNDNISERVNQSYVASEDRRFDRVEFNTEQIQSENMPGAKAERPDFRAVSLIKASAIDPPEIPDVTEQAAEAVTTEPNMPAQADISAANDFPEVNAENIENQLSDVAQRAVSAGDSAGAERYINYTAASFQRMEEQTSDSYSVRSSRDIAEENEPARITPARSQGIETYQRFQNYSNSLNLSNAQAAV